MTRLWTCFVLLLSALPLTRASAWTHTFPAETATETRLQLRVAAPDQLYAVDPNGSVIALGPELQVQGAFRGDPSVYFATMRDGGLLTAVSNKQPSEFRSLDAQFQPRWLNRLPRPGSLAFDGPGNLWVLGGTTLDRVSVDGVLRATHSMQVEQFRGAYSFVADPVGSGVVVVGNFGLPPPQPQSYGAISFAADGSVRWVWVDPRPDIRQFTIRRTSRGDLLLVGVINSFAGGVTVLTADGQLRWRYSTPTEDTSTFAALPDGSVLVHSYGRFSNPTLTKLDADGQVSWRQVRDTVGTYMSYAQLAVHPAGGVVVVERINSPYLKQTRVDRIDLQGNRLWRQDRVDVANAGILRGDGRMLRSLDDGTVEQYAGADGARSAFALTSPLLDNATPLATDVGPDGSYIASIKHRETSALTLVNASGQPSWRQRSASKPYVGVAFTRSDRVCGAQMETDGASFSCLKASDGRLLWQTRAYAFNNSQFLAYRGLPDGRQLLALQYGVANAGGNGLQLLIVDGDGQLIVQRELANAAAASARFSDNGELAIVTSGTGAVLLRVGQDGQLRYRIPVASFGNILDLAPLASGQTLLRLSTSLAAELDLVDAAGNLRWRHVLANPQTDQIEVIDAGDTLYVAGFTAGSMGAAAPTVPVSTPLLSLKASDGSQRWQALVPSLDHQRAGKQIGLDRQGQRLWFATPLREHYEIQSFATADGHALGQRLLPLAPAKTLLDARLTPAGELRLLSRIDLPNQPIQLRVEAHSDVLSDSSTPPIEHIGRSGAWYDPSSAGQGWLIDIIPASRTVYAAWFTYLSSDDPLQQSPARLRWYSLQGTYSPGATEVELEVLENRGGNFAAPPATSARRIGTAKLRFDGCGNGLLEYRFDESGLAEVQNRVAMRALAIRDSSCATSAPTQQAQGFSAAASGAWFDPATAGQGLLSVVQPPIDGPGLFFAGWFHYDPAGKADDPLQQSWLTLQGPLQAGREGKAEVGIFRTLGGRLSVTATNNTLRIGTAQIEFTGCDRLRLSYQFDPGELAAPYSDISGVQVLSKIGECVN